VFNYEKEREQKKDSFSFVEKLSKHINLENFETVFLKISNRLFKTKVDLYVRINYSFS